MGYLGGQIISGAYPGAPCKKNDVHSSRLTGGEDFSCQVIGGHYQFLSAPCLSAIMATHLIIMVIINYDGDDDWLIDYEKWAFTYRLRMKTSEDDDFPVGSFQDDEPLEIAAPTDENRYVYVFVNLPFQLNESTT